MLWGQRQVDEFSSTINDTISEWDVKAILAMNEYVLNPSRENFAL
jgi:hypothetical protein